MHRAFGASVEQNNDIANSPTICMITEPYTAFKKIANVHHNYIALPNATQAERPRAAILLPRLLRHTFLDQLSGQDRVVALVSTKSGLVLLASVYLDIHKDVVQPWLKEIVEYAERKRVPLLMAMDSNAHSQLYGPDTKARGEKLEEFILQYNLKVENRGMIPTFRVNRGDRQIASCIDVTLSSGDLPIQDWRVHPGFNGSDHDTITWTLDMALEDPHLIRPWSTADWKLFKYNLKQHEFFSYPDTIATETGQIPRENIQADL